MRSLAATAGFFVLSACVSASMNDGLRPFIGHPASAAFARIGMPTSEQVIAGRKAYIWSTSHLVGSHGDLADYNCTIRLFVDAADIVTSYDGEGNLGGCANYLSSLHS